MNELRKFSAVALKYPEGFPAPFISIKENGLLAQRMVEIAKENNVPLVIAKSASDRMSKILKRVGADKVICPEEEGGIRSARILTSQYIHDYYEISDNLCMVELYPKKSWVGKNLIELNLRKKYNMNIAAIKAQGGSWTYVDPSHKMKEDNLLLIIIDKEDVLRLTGNGINHRPYTLGISIYLLAILRKYLPVTLGEILHSTLNPRCDRDMVMLARHILKFYGKTREHPCLVERIEV